MQADNQYKIILALVQPGNSFTGFKHDEAAFVMRQVIKLKQIQVIQLACKLDINGRGCLTLLTEVTGQAVIQVLIELSTVSPLQPGAQAKVRQLHMTLERQMFITQSISTCLADPSE